MRPGAILLRGTSTIACLLVPLAAHAEVSSPVADAPSAPPNQGQAEASTTQPSQPASRDIVVTGSRLRSGLAAPTPLVAVSSEQLRAASPMLISDALNQLPMFKNSSSAANGTGSSSRDNGGSYLNLRGLGKERTLVLVDGRRMVASTSGGATDISVIPQDLVRTVDIVTGGASAAYGSDAVAGVVNFRLDTGFTGLRLNAQAGISTYGDDGLRRTSLTAGTGFAGTGHVVASVEYFRSDGIGRGPTGRRIIDHPYGLGPTGLANPTMTIIHPSLYTAARGGLINTGPLAGNRFLADGTLVPFNFGTNRDALRQAGGDGFQFEAAPVAAVERYSAFSHVEYGNTVKVFGEALFSQSTVDYPYLPNQQATVFSNAATIFRENPFVPAAIAGTVFGTGNSFTLSNIEGSTPFMEINARTRTFRLTAGLDWEIGSGWSLSTYGMHGESRYRVLNRNVGNIRNLYAALDAVRDPATGNIVCRSTLAGFDPGCVPINIMGGNPISAAALAYAFGTSELDFHLKEDVASAILRGSPLTLPAGKIDLAAGIEYRREAAVQTSDVVSNAIVSTVGIRGLPANYSRGLPGGWVFSAAAPFKGSYNVLEGFAEASVPIFKDSPLGHSFTLNGAVRQIHYSTVGTVTTWKAGAIYEPIADLRLRGTLSRDIRAGNINELFAGNQILAASFVYQGVQRSGIAIRSGNPNLKPEKADTLTLGTVFRPHWLPGLGLSIDYYRIKVRDAIAQLSAPQTAAQCAAGAQFACDLITVVPGSATVLTPTLNLASLKTSGVDVELDYSHSLGPGRLSARAIVSYLHELTTQLPNSAKIDRAGDLGLQGAPKWQGYLTIGYTVNGGFSANLQERYIGSGKIDSTFAPTVLGDANNVPATWYTDIYLAQELITGRRRLKVFASVNNLFNQQPRITPATPIGPYRSTNPQLYDIIGRYFTAGVTINF